MSYYDGTKLLSLKDINGNKPEIYLCTTNRTAGKTTYFNRLLVNRFKRKGEKFMLLYRYGYEIDDCADTFFKDIKGLFFPTDDMTQIKKSKGLYVELYLNNVHCGYAITLNNSEIVKKKSHLFSDTANMLLDEFQSETNKYCPDEITKFISVHASVARGQGEQTRYVPVFMCGNAVTILNPYFSAMNIGSRLRADTKFLRGEGFVLETGFVESASESLKNSAFNQAFAKNNYIAYASQNVYLNDNNAFVESPKGKGRYLMTIKYKGKDYGIVEFPEQGILWCNDSGDSSFRLKITATTEDHQINYVMLKNNSFLITNLRFYFDKGCFRFKNLQCKDTIINVLSY